MAGSKIRYPHVWLFCAFASLGAFLYGYDGVYFGGVSTLPPFINHFGSLKADGSHAISPSQLSLMTSMINLGELVGSVGAAPLNDYLGRKGVFFIGCIWITLGVALQLAASSPPLMIAGRAILGLGVGNFSATSPLYMGEIAPESMRSPLLMCWQLTISISQILAAAINRGMISYESTFSYRFPIAFQLIFPIIVYAFLWFVPESPRWLIRKGRADQAETNLRRLHRDDKTYDPRAALEMMHEDVRRESELEAESSWLQLLTDPVERRKVIFSAGALVAQQINGIQWFYYFGTVFSEDIGLSDPFLMTLIVFIIQVFVVLAAVLLANKLPRRPLLMVTTAIMTISIFIVGCLGIPNPEPSAMLGKVVISFVIIEIVAFNFAWGPLGWTIASEMAVGRNRNKIYAVAVASFWITVFVTVFTLPYLYYSANLGSRTGFVYTGACVITWLYVYFCVGEVNGRSFEEIDQFFRDGIPARKWRDQPRSRLLAAGVDVAGGAPSSSLSEEGGVGRDEEKYAAGVHTQTEKTAL